ncbi:hypothetical protein ACIBQ1_06270 [Nonomuraea sp. NPDC050153]|uniref:hypothetical protein n=1 Tax=Nonomuraea sp. NPDC050153 TaxID=3364359 RepID=UPI0037AD6B33
MKPGAVREGCGFPAREPSTGSGDVVTDARTAMGAYYEFTGMADRMVAGMLTTPGQIRECVTQYAELGVDEVMLYCYGRDPGQVDRLAEVVSAL